MGRAVSDELTAIEDWATALQQRIAPGGRRQVARAIAIELRRSQQQRIAAQRDPDDQPFAPRKPRKDLRGKRGRIKRGAMFAKLRQARWLKTRVTGTGVEVGFFGRVGHIASVHQYGQVDAVAPNGPRVRYPARRLLGFTAADRTMIRDRLIDHLSR